jgi:superfamily II DNA or RNA helicase
VAVDILNEGIDVPNVNLVCFARVTHSRRIFIQQLGRGLRVANYKDKVVVLDFAADVKRLAAIHNLQTAIDGDGDVEVVPYHNNTISFTDQGCKALIEEWIKDAADLETRTEESRLQFPPT